MTLTGKASPNYGALVRLVEEHTNTPGGLTVHTIADAMYGGDLRRASHALGRWRLVHPDRPLFSARHSNEKAKHWFQTKAAANAYAAIDPRIRVIVQRGGGARVVNGKQAVDIPAVALQRIIGELTRAAA